MWISKNKLYESPYNVIGIIKLTGLERSPKNIYVKIVLLERDKLRISELLQTLMIVLRKSENYNLV